MNHSEIKDLDYVDRYLAGTLSPRELSAFETHILGCQECLDELELSERMRTGFKDAFASGPAAQVGPLAAGTGRKSPVRYAVAASVLLAAGVLTTGLLKNFGGSQLGPAPAQMFPIHATRSVGETPDNLLRLSSPGTTAVLLIDPGPEDFADYRARVWRMEGPDLKAVTDLSGLTPSYEDLLAVTVPSTDLRAGDYRIELAGRADPDASYDHITRFTFRVVE